MKTILYSFQPSHYSFFTRLKNVSIVLALALCMLPLFVANAAEAKAPVSGLEIAIDDNCPTAYFIVKNNGAPVGTPIIFENFSSPGSSYLWDFGDGKLSTQVQPQHSYANKGTYLVVLSVTKNGCTTFYVITVDVVLG